MAPRFAYLDLAVHRDLYPSKPSYDLHPAGPGPSYLLTPTDNPFADPLEDEEDYDDEDAQPISFPSLLARDFTAPFSPSSSPVSSTTSETETETETDADDDTPPQTPDVDAHALLPFDHGFDHKRGLVTTTAVGYDDEYGVPSVATGYDPTPFVAGLPLLDELYLRSSPPSSSPLSPPSSSPLQTLTSSATSPLCLYDPLWHAAPSSLPSVFLHPAPPSAADVGGGVTSDPGRDAQDWDWLVVPARAATGRLSDEDEEYYVSQSEDEGSDVATVESIGMKETVGGEGEEDVVGSGRTRVQTFVTLRSFVPVRVPGRRWLWKNF